MIKESFYKGLKFAKVVYRLLYISHAIQTHTEKNGFLVVRSLVGHWIGKNLHESTNIPNYGKPNKGAKLKSGMVLAIEPMIN